MTPAEEKFVIMAKMAGVQDHPLAVGWTGLDAKAGCVSFRLEDAGNGKVLLTSWQMIAKPTEEEGATILRMLRVFEKMDPFDFDATFPELFPSMAIGRTLLAIRENPSIYPMVSAALEELAEEQPVVRKVYDACKHHWELHQ
ncbi:hypothetical protein ACLBV5_09785 [Brevundimonas sp. M1A4_2e]